MLVFLVWGFKVKNIRVMFAFAIVSLLLFSEYHFVVGIVQG
jgi:hypothetical protein